ncbi:MAG: hypothetical protein WDW38_010433 [Sanguina aurantia]
MRSIAVPGTGGCYSSTRSGETPHSIRPTSVPGKQARNNASNLAGSGSSSSSSRCSVIAGATSHKSKSNGGAGARKSLHNTIVVVDADRKVADVEAKMEAVEDLPSSGPAHASNNIVSAGERAAASFARPALPPWFMHRTTRPPSHRALVLDCSYRPINVVSWFKAVNMQMFEKAEVLVYYAPPARAVSGQGDHSLPAVIRVPQYIARVEELCSKVACTRRNVLVRDNFQCQYCGSKKELTLDHVHPQCKGGGATWANLVTACQKCNQKKGARLLKELGWRLRVTPAEPSPFAIGIVAGVSIADILLPPEEWLYFIQPYREKLEEQRRQAESAGESYE